MAALAARILDPLTDEGPATAAGAVWGMILLRRMGKIGGPTFDACLKQMMREAASAARQISPAAFPAVLCATLARADLRSSVPGEFEKRRRLIWSALVGRL